MEIGVFALIRNPEGKVLLVKDATRQQLWTLPGGGPDLGELVQDTLVREVKEEAGINIRARRLIGVFSQRKTLGIVLLFEAETKEGVPSPDGVETSACEYFSLEELLKMRDTIKPAQLSMVYQALTASVFPIFNHFIVPEVEN